MSNGITRRLKRGVRNKSLRDGLVFRTDSVHTKPLPVDTKAANRAKGKQARIARRQNRG